MAESFESKKFKFQDSKIFYYGWMVVGMAFLANLMTYGLVYSFGVFLKPVASEFGWSRSVTAGAFGVYGILHSLLAVLAGGLCDQLGPKLVLTISGFFLGLSMILMATITKVWDLFGVAVGPSLGGYIFDATRSYNTMIIMCGLSTLPLPPLFWLRF